MNFFAHQEQARRQTQRMLWLFALAVVAIVAAIDFVLVAALGLGNASHTNGGIGWGGLFVVSAFVVLVIGLGSLYRTASLRGGGGVVARGWARCRYRPIRAISPTVACAMSLRNW